jgi:GntR family transcriptional repressor for pyruvate dehydrogenase complex
LSARGTVAKLAASSTSSKGWLSIMGVMTASLDTEVRRKRAASLIVDDLRRQIIRGDIPEDSRLPSEAELLATYGVSRPTMRQALRLLESEGLILVRHGQRNGAQVRRPSLEVAARYTGLLLQSMGTTMSDLFEARLYFEPALVRRLAESRTPEAVAELRALVADEESGNYDAAKSPELFRAALSRHSGNSVITVLMGVISELGGSFTEERSRKLPRDRVEKTQKVGRRLRSQLVELIAEGQADEAESLWEQYLRGGLRVTKRTGEGDLPIDVVR